MTRQVNQLVMCDMEQILNSIKYAINSFLQSLETNNLQWYLFSSLVEMRCVEELQEHGGWIVEFIQKYAMHFQGVSLDDSTKEMGLTDY